MVINNGENKDMVIKRLRFPVIFWSSKYLKKDEKVNVQVSYKKNCEVNIQSSSSAIGAYEKESEVTFCNLERKA